MTSFTNSLGTFNLLDRDWVSPGFSYEFLMQLVCNERNHVICYATTPCEIHTFKNKNKTKSLRDIFVYQKASVYS